MTEPERWAPVVGYEGFYEVSSLGRVKSLPRRYSPNVTYMATYPGKRGGYPTVGLTRNRVSVPKTVHLLMARAFYGPANGRQVRHLDGNPDNCTLANLAYGTGAENAQDTIRHGRNWRLNVDRCPQGHEYTPENTYRPKSRPNSRYCIACAIRRGSWATTHPNHPNHVPGRPKQRRLDPDVCAAGRHPRTSEFGRPYTHTDRKGRTMTQWRCRPCKAESDKRYRDNKKAA